MDMVTSWSPKASGSLEPRKSFITFNPPPLNNIIYDLPHIDMALSIEILPNISTNLTRKPFALKFEKCDPYPDYPLIRCFGSCCTTF